MMSESKQGADLYRVGAKEKFRARQEIHKIVIDELGPEITWLDFWSVQAAISLYSCSIFFPCVRAVDCLVYSRRAEISNRQNYLSPYVSVCVCFIFYCKVKMG